MSFSFLSTLTLFGALGRVIHAQFQVQTPITTDTPDAYYIGMDLSASYGAVAVAFTNDTTVPIARIEGSDDYKTLLAQLARQDRWEPEPPWTPIDPRETAILSRMITDLKIRAEDRLGVKVNSTLVATPDLPYLYDNTVHASIQDAGLEDMDYTHVSYGYSFKQPSGAMAGWGIGMCHEWWDLPACYNESGHWPLKNVITVLYTSNSLCVALGDSKGIYGHQTSHTYPSSMDFTLGYDERNNNPDEAFYWEAVRERMMTGALGTVAFPLRDPSVFVYGDKDAVDDLKFRQVLNGSIHDVLKGSVPIYYPEDPVFLVARGTASVVRRGKYGLKI